MQLIVFLKRATGIGYRPFPPISEHVSKAKDNEQKSLEIKDQIDHLTEELAYKHGFNIKNKRNG